MSYLYSPLVSLSNIPPSRFPHYLYTSSVLPVIFSYYSPISPLFTPSTSLPLFISLLPSSSPASTIFISIPQLYLPLPITTKLSFPFPSPRSFSPLPLSIPQSCSHHIHYLNFSPLSFNLIPVLSPSFLVYSLFLGLSLPRPYLFPFSHPLLVSTPQTILYHPFHLALSLTLSPNPANTVFTILILFPCLPTFLLYPPFLPPIPYLLSPIPSAPRSRDPLLTTILKPCPILFISLSIPLPSILFRPRSSTRN